MIYPVSARRALKEREEAKGSVEDAEKMDEFESALFEFMSSDKNMLNNCDHQSNK